MPFVITQQHDTNPRHIVNEPDMPWELTSAYRTKKAAEIALSKRVPEGKDPGLYGNYRVERRAYNHTMFIHDDV
jgi:hypothetical protein